MPDLLYTTQKKRKNTPDDRLKDEKVKIQKYKKTKRLKD